MPETYANVTQLINATLDLNTHAALNPPASGDAPSKSPAERVPTDIYLVGRPGNQRIVAYVAKPGKKGQAAQVYLKRLDWKRLSPFQRFCATVAAFLGLDIPCKTRLSTAQCVSYRITRSASIPELLLGDPPTVAAAKPVSRESAHADRSQAPCQQAGPIRDEHLVADFVKAFGPFVKTRLAAIHALRLPREQELVLEDELVQQMRARVERAFKARCLDPAALTEVLCRVGLHTVQFLPPSEIAAHARSDDPTVALLNRRLGRVEICLDDIPHRDPVLAKQAQLVLGDVHGNCLLLLHALVRMGLVRIVNETAWLSMCAKLDALDGKTASQSAWPLFMADIRTAIAVEPGADNRRLTLLGDVIAGPMHCDAMMLGILFEMDRMGLRYRCICGNHEGEFLSYYLRNKDRKAAKEYSMAGTGVGMTRESGQAASLHRLHDMLTSGGLPLPEFHAMVEKGLLQHLDLVGCSDDGTAFYGHAFANAAVMAPLYDYASVQPTDTLHQCLRKVNEWFRTILLGGWDNLSQVIHTARWSHPRYPVSPVRALLWNIGLDEEYADELGHPCNAAVSLPHPATRYQVHGHCRKVADRAQALSAEATTFHNRMQKVAAALNELPPNVDAISAFARRLHRLHPGSRADEMAMIAMIVATILVFGNHPKMEILGNLFGERDPAAQCPSVALHALAKAWQTKYPPKSGHPTFDPDRLAPAQRMQLFQAIHDGLSVVSKTKSRRLQAQAVLGRAKNRLLAIQEAMRANLPAPSASSPPGNVHRTPEKVLGSYLRVLDTRFHSLDSPAGNQPRDRRFSRLVHVIEDGRR